MEQKRIEIKLKECCLTCEDFNPLGSFGFGYGLTDDRVIVCDHMKVCWKYLAKDSGTVDELLADSQTKE